MRCATFLLLLACAGCAAAPVTPAPPTGEVDTRCRVDADCAIKDVGNCCGRFPACVNRESPVFPERVKAECERKGLSGVCGFPVIEACACVQGHCAASEPAQTE